MDGLGMTSIREQIDQEIEEEIQGAVQFAESSAYPAPETAMDYVYV
jgi:TPP-dependent pyruvate/acetoin dehydrogenase alpha subunit